MNRAALLENFDPNGVGLNNGHFIGLPFEEAQSDLIVLSVPWDVTVSYGAGTATAAQNILQTSPQLDLYDADAPDAWKRGIYLMPPDHYWEQVNAELRPKAAAYIEFLESGGQLKAGDKWTTTLDEINTKCAALKQWVKESTTNLIAQGKLVGLLGGDHSVPLGFLEALAEQYEAFGILQIDAHLDLRQAYEGFTYSHASIFYNALQLSQVVKLVQVGIRDYCDAELEIVQQSKGRVEVFYDHQVQRMQYEGSTFAHICTSIINQLPKYVYVSFDIDGLDPELCPNTGTPVPGGLDYNQALYLLTLIKASGRTIVGFDLCEVAGKAHEWDGNVGARVLYKLCGQMLRSHSL